MRNPKDIVKLDIPLLLRLLEFAREDATSDEELHKVVSNSEEQLSERKKIIVKDRIKK